MGESNINWNGIIGRGGGSTGEASIATEKRSSA